MPVLVYSAVLWYTEKNRKIGKGSDSMKKAIRFAGMLLLVSIFTAAFSFLTEGVPLFGMPKTDEVARVVIEHRGYPDAVKEFTDAENIELAVALSGYLRYSPLKGLSDDNWLIQITYILNNGNQCTVSANAYTVWWNGTARALRNENTFVKLCTAVFFSEDKLIYGASGVDSGGHSINGEGGQLISTDEKKA